MDLESFVHGSGKWFCTSLYSRPPANGFRVFRSWHWKWCKCSHIPIVDPSAPRAVSCCHKLNEIGASSSRTKGKYWNSLKILNNLFESERVLPSIHEVPKFSTCILQLDLNSTVCVEVATYFYFIRISSPPLFPLFGFGSEVFKLQAPFLS